MSKLFRQVGSVLTVQPVSQQQEKKNLDAFSKKEDTRPRGENRGNH